MKQSDTFIDEVVVRVFGGDGGDGCVSMRREKFVPRGGPDGGDGGRGGNVTLRADRNLATLMEQRMKRVIRAGNGVPGMGKRKDGKDGESIEILLPVGTLVYDHQAEPAVLVDLCEDGATFLTARGGRGGRGNAQFSTATRQTPDFAERGQPGQIRVLRLSLKLLADVGLVGYPNAGKSTLLSGVSAARPRVAAYAFTTLIPNLGVAEVDDRRFVVADIPGLIEGASEGAGLGDRFLRHIERTRVLVHLIDVGMGLMEERDLIEVYESIRTELGAYEKSLLTRREIVALNKVDLVADRARLDPIEKELHRRGCEVHRISGATGEGIAGLLRAMVSAIDAEASDGEPS